MKIVVLNSRYLNLKSSDWEELKELGDVTIYEKTQSDEIIERTKDADIALATSINTPLTREILTSLPKLRYIGLLCTGTNSVDLKCAKELNMVVTNVPDYCSATVAQMVFSLLLELTNQVGTFNHLVHQGGWNPKFNYWEKLLVELEGSTMGIIGFGNIGKRVARMASAFGMNVLINTRTVPKQKDFTFCELNELLQKSDVISLNCPLTEKTKQMVNAQFLSQMKSSAYLINTSRGWLVDETALANALNNNQIAGAALDVMPQEPPDPKSPLLKAKNCVITPHVAWVSQKSLDRLLKIGFENLKAFINGKPVNVVT